MKFRKHIAIASAACMMLTGTAVLPALTVSAEEEKQYETSGSYNTITWNYDKETKTLTVSGTGETGTFDPYRSDRLGSSPWWAFWDELEHVVVTEGITKLGYNLFSECYGLQSVQLPESLTEIDSGAFAGCFCLKDISIPKSVTKFGANVFYETAWLKIQRNENRRNQRPQFIYVNDILIDGAEHGSYYASGSSLSGSNLDATLTAIAGGAFFKAQHIGDVDLTNTYLLTDIGDMAFEDSSITSVVLPDCVNHIGEEAFAQCRNLTEVTIQNAFCEISDDSSTISNSGSADNRFTGTIRGYTDSTAQAYAEKYGYKFESIGDAPEVKQGDFNGDEQIALDDAQAVLQYYTQTLAGRKPLTANALKQSADVNGDGAADIMDAQYILKYYTENSVAGLYTTWEDILK